MDGEGSDAEGAGMRMLPLLIAFALFAAGIGYALAAGPPPVRGTAFMVRSSPPHAP